jgi:flagellar motor component MotA
MFLIIGYVIILAASVGTYALHGSLAALWVPAEYVAIFGLMIGGFVAGNGMPAIKATVAALPTVFKGSSYNKAFYVDVLAMLYEILSKVRKEGLMSIEADVENPEASPIFSKYPKFLSDHHAVDFLTDYLRMMVGGNLNAFEIESLMDAEMETHHSEAHVAVHCVSKVADGVPAFGIVVAVMGVVNVMGSVGAAAGGAWQDDRRCAGRYLPRHSAFVRFRRADRLAARAEDGRGRKDLPVHEGGAAGQHEWLRAAGRHRVRPQGSVLARPSEFQGARRRSEEPQGQVGPRHPCIDPLPINALKH